MNTRLVVVKILQQVIQHGRNLPDAISSTLEKTQTDIIETTEFDRDRALIQAMCYGVIRLYPRLQFIADQLISKPLKAKDFDILLLILSGLYQLIEMRIPDHAAVSETVKITSALKKPWAKNLVNAFVVLPTDLPTKSAAALKSNPFALRLSFILRSIYT